MMDNPTYPNDFCDGGPGMGETRKNAAQTPPTIVSNVVWSSFGQISALVLGFASSVVLARWLGPEARGVYALIVASAGTLAAMLGSSSLVAALAYLTGKGIHPLRQLVGQGLCLISIGTVVLISAVTLLPLGIINAALPGLVKGQLLLVVLLTASMLLQAILTGILVGLDEIRLYTLISTSGFALTFGAQVVFLVLMGVGLKGAQWQIALLSIWIFATAIIVLGWKAGFDPRPRKSAILGIAVYGAKTYPAQLGSLLLARLDLFFVALLVGPAAAGIYAVAKGLAEVITMVEQAVSFGVAPKIVSGGRQEAAAIVSRTFRITFWINLMLASLSACSAHWFVPLLYGHEFGESAHAFVLLLPGVLFLTTRVLGSFFSLQLGRPEIPTLYILATGLASVPVSYLATQHFGYAGTAAVLSAVSLIRAGTAVVLFLSFSRQSVKHLFIPNHNDLRDLLRFIKGSRMKPLCRLLRP